MWTIPVAIDNICFPVSIKICQSHTTAMLHWILNPCINIYIYTFGSVDVLQYLVIQTPHTYKFLGSPACAATSVNVPSPLLRNRKLGLYSLSQNISDRLSLSMGPTTTPRPPVVRSKDRHIYHKQCANHYCLSSPFLRPSTLCFC